MLDVVFYAGKEIRAADICEETNASLRHGVHSVISCYSDGSMHRHTDTAAHYDPVPNTDLERLHLSEGIVEHILIMEELSLNVGVNFASSRIINHLDVAASAESFSAHTADEEDSWSALG